MTFETQFAEYQERDNEDCGVLAREGRGSRGEGKEGRKDILAISEIMFAPASIKNVGTLKRTGQCELFPDGLLRHIKVSPTQYHHHKQLIP